MRLTCQITGEVAAVAGHVVMVANLLPERLELEAVGVVVEASFVKPHGHTWKPNDDGISTTCSSSATSPTSASPGR
jgi:hypothetical protein